MTPVNKIKPKNSPWLDLKTALSKLSNSELINLIRELYSLEKVNEDFLDARFRRSKEVMERYKEKIQIHLAPYEPWKDNQPISISSAKKVLSDYKKATKDKLGLIDLMVHYVECGTDFLCEFGDAYEQYYISLESVFEHVLKIMKEFEEADMQGFIQRLKVVVKKADEYTGWGYYDAISDMLYQAYRIQV
jgi:hypothetical protein